MIFFLFHLIGLLFLKMFYKLKVNIMTLMLVLAFLLLYYFTMPETSYLAMLMYSWIIYFLNMFLLSKNFHSAYHISIFVIVMGLFMSLLVSGDAFYYYQYMYEFTFDNMVIMIGHLALMSVIFALREKISFYKDLLYTSRFTYINLFIHFQIVLIHVLRDLDFINRYIPHDDEYYYQTLFTTNFIFYFLLILSSIFWEKKRAEEKVLFQELKQKQDELRDLFETKPYQYIKELKEMGKQRDYDALLKETEQYMGYVKKVSHKRILDKLEDDLLAHVTMEKINKEENVAFEVIVEHQSQNMFSKEQYFLEMYRIVLDNAVEAAKKADLRYVKIVFEKNRVVVENSFVEEDISYLLEKDSLKGRKRRINGLKLLDYLTKESNINVSVDIRYRVIVEMEVDYA